jgi:hypothetical protein
LTRSGFETMIYCTRGEHANHYTTDAVSLLLPSTNKTDHHDITEILLKVALNTIIQTNK